ncbi:MAG TPA: MmpS family transport accessory protein [Mycobacterium sp.]|nr:MmpS family transport accessory protein [Mycobacterium sp.]
MALVRRMWIPLVMLVVIALASFMVIRLHGVFGRQSASAGGADPADTLVQFNPKHVLYDVWAPPGTEVEVDYLDEHAQPQRVLSAAVPWHYEIVTTDTAVIATVVAQGEADSIGCRITVNGQVRDERTFDGHRAQTHCIVKSA